MPGQQVFPWFRPAPGDPCFCRSGREFGACCGSHDADRDPPVGVRVFPGFLNPATCARWVRRLESMSGRKALVNKMQRSGPGPFTVEDDPVRVCTEVHPGVLRKQINDRVAEAFRVVAAETGDTVAWYEMPMILRYRAGGYYLAHADSCALDPSGRAWVKLRDRDLSLLIYLNDDFTGGGLTFANFNFHFRPQPGDLVVFPSDNRYIHQAEEVNSGVRYVIVSWAALAGVPRVHPAPPDNVIFP